MHRLVKFVYYEALPTESASQIAPFTHLGHRLFVSLGLTTQEMT